MEQPSGKGKILYGTRIIPDVRADASFDARLNIISQTLTLKGEKTESADTVKSALLRPSISLEMSALNGREGKEPLIYLSISAKPGM